jgi:hypothetical protein
MNLQGDGSVQGQLTIPFLQSERILIPKGTVMNDFGRVCVKIYNMIDYYKKEYQLLNKALGLLQTKLSKN